MQNGEGDVCTICCFITNETVFSDHIFPTNYTVGFCQKIYAVHLHDVQTEEMCSSHPATFQALMISPSAPAAFGPELAAVLRRLGGVSYCHAVTNGTFNHMMKCAQSQT